MQNNCENIRSAFFQPITSPQTTLLSFMAKQIPNIRPVQRENKEFHKSFLCALIKVEFRKK